MRGDVRSPPHCQFCSKRKHGELNDEDESRGEVQPKKKRAGRKQPDTELPAAVVHFRSCIKLGISFQRPIAPANPTEITLQEPQILQAPHIEIHAERSDDFEEGELNENQRREMYKTARGAFSVKPILTGRRNGRNCSGRVARATSTNIRRSIWVSRPHRRALRRASPSTHHRLAPPVSELHRSRWLVRAVPLPKCPAQRVVLARCPRRRCVRRALRTGTTSGNLVRHVLPRKGQRHRVERCANL